jgi:predicted transport protein
MSDIKLFTIRAGLVSELSGSSVQIEKDLQALFERNLEKLLGIRFLASEFSTGPVHGGRIDTLGLDEDRCPVIIEYKRSTNENVINQGLYYLHWLMDHKGDFERLVHRVLGADFLDQIDWSNPRLLCIASDFTRYDEHAVKQINRNVELLRYRRFGDQTLLIDVVHAPKVSKFSPANPSFSFHPANEAAVNVDPYQSQRIDYRLANASLETRDVFDAVRNYLICLGSDVLMKELKCYIAFKRVKNFACVEVHPKARIVTAYLKLDPESVSIEPGFTRDMRRIGHFGTGELEVSMKSLSEVSRAQPLMQIAYDRSCAGYDSPWSWDGAVPWSEGRRFGS